MFSSTSFVVLGLTLRSVICSELVFIWYMVWVEDGFFAHGYLVVPEAHFSIELTLHLCQKSVDHMSVSVSDLFIPFH